VGAKGVVHDGWVETVAKFGILRHSSSFPFLNPQ